MQEYYHMDKTREVGGGGASHGDAGELRPLSPLPSSYTSYSNKHHCLTPFSGL